MPWPAPNSRSSPAIRAPAIFPRRGTRRSLWVVRHRHQHVHGNAAKLARRGRQGQCLAASRTRSEPEGNGFGFSIDLGVREAQDKSLVELIVGQQVFQRPVIATQDTPGARLAILRAAFMAALNDQQLLAEAGKSKLELNPRSGEDVEALVRKMYSAPKDLILENGENHSPLSGIQAGDDCHLPVRCRCVPFGSCRGRTHRAAPGSLRLAPRAADATAPPPPRVPD